MSRANAASQYKDTRLTTRQYHGQDDDVQPMNQLYCKSPAVAAEQYDRMSHDEKVPGRKWSMPRVLHLHPLGEPCNDQCQLVHRVTWQEASK